MPPPAPPAGSPPRSGPGSPPRKGVVTIGGRDFGLMKRDDKASRSGPKNRRVVFADDLGRQLSHEREFARGQPLHQRHEPLPRKPPILDLLSPETRAMIREAAAMSRRSFAEAAERELGDDRGVGPGGASDDDRASSVSDWCAEEEEADDGARRPPPRPRASSSDDDS